VQSISDTINYLVKNKHKFVIYNLPNSENISLVVSKDKNTKETFVIQDFDTSSKEYLIEKDIFLENKNISISNINKLNLKKYKNNFGINQVKIFSKKEYENYVSLVVEKCKNGIIKKGVPARIISSKKPENFNIGNFFLKLVQKYTTAFVNLYYHPDCGLWIGATPELLVKEIGENIYETFSLAGTKLISKNRDWTAKEFEEQQIVTNYISNILIKNNCKLEMVSKPKTIIAGSIQHLKTTIQFSSKNSLNYISKILHPTPAVCGMPLKKSFALIKKVEDAQRLNYTGFIGLNYKNNKQLYVNLRCMQVLEKEFLVYVGAGVTKDSIPEQEWFETENKSKTLLSVLTMN